MTKNKVLLISGVNPTTAYSCIKYLFNELVRRNYEVSIWSAVPHGNKSYKEWGNNAHSFFEKGLGRIPKVRMVYMYFAGFVVAFKYRNQTIICHDLYHYASVTIIKKIFPKTKVIHYCTEIFTKNNTKNQLKQEAFYERHLKTADFCIECNEQRAIYRRKKFGLTIPYCVILNTVPKAEIEKYVKKEKVVNSEPVVVYSGGAFKVDELDIIADAIKLLKNTCKVVFYLYGNNNLLNEIEKRYRSISNLTIVKNTRREELFSKIQNSDIGIMYYDPKLTVNTKYAAPTKFFEYIALNIPVVCSNNESLTKLIDKYNLGIYMKSNTPKGMAECIDELLSKPEKVKEIRCDEKNAFENYLCYERQSAVGLNSLMRYL